MTWMARLMGGVFVVGVLTVVAAAQTSPDLYAGLRWRNIGPFRGGRVASVTGVIGQPGVFYAGLPGGGIWKTVSAGEVWYPIFDAVTGADSVGAIAVAPSNPNIIYAGTGDMVNGERIGDGMYKSTDAGQTWAHIGLEDTQHINTILVDPTNPDIVLASTRGDLRKARPDRGIYRSTDGGMHWTQVLLRDDATGSLSMAWAFDQPTVVFATTVADVRGGGAAPTPAAPVAVRTSLYKSMDEGVTWTEVQVTGLAPRGSGNTCVAVAMNTHSQRVYVVGPTGLYRSDDQGATWTKMAVGDNRINGNYICGVYTDPRNPDIVYDMNTSMYRSTDGGRSFVSFKGAPGGDDDRVLWIDPTNGQRMLLGSDQGATISFDGGFTWSSWYNQPTGQFFHISTDSRYPYWVLGTQFDSFAIMTRSRGNLGEITPLDWYPVAGDEYGSIVADPRDPNIIYAGNYLIRKSVESTGAFENVGPNVNAVNHYRVAGSPKVLFDAIDKKTLYASFQCMTKTQDGGLTWKDISPDLTVAAGKPSVACDSPTATTAGDTAASQATLRLPTIVSFAVSTVQTGVIWTVSSNGQVYNTMDGGLHWTNVTHFTDLPIGTSGFTSIEAGHSAVNTAYVAISASDVGDFNPYIWKTHDGGKTWMKIVNGLPTTDRAGDVVSIVREDPKQKGLLYCGTETSVYGSFDDGEHWQSLRLNLPTTAVRDMVFHNDDHMNDLVVGTYGRGIWVLDDVTPLRQIAARSQEIAAAPAYLFQPGDAIRVRRDVNTATPFPPEVPHAENPPLGAIIYYHLSQPPHGEITLQVFDAAGTLVRTMSSILAPGPDVLLNVPDYWLRPPQATALPTAVGTNRTHWDLRYDNPPVFSHDTTLTISAVPHDTPLDREGPLALPGAYTVKLTVDGKVYSQALVVHNDPRSGERPATLQALQSAHKLVMLAYQGMKDAYTGNSEVAALRAQIKSLADGPLPPDVAAAATALDAKLATLGGSGSRPSAAPGGVVAFTAFNGSYDFFGGIVNNVGHLDMAPSQPQIKSWETDCGKFNMTVTAWKAAESQDVVVFNALLTRNNLKPLLITPTALTVHDCHFIPAAAHGKH